MSERRGKRANKKKRLSVRSLQARKESHGLQAETESMPQRQSEAVAEINRTKNEGGYKMSRHVSIVDRIKEHKAIIIQVAVVVAIAVIVGAIMVPSLAPSKSLYATDIARLDGGIAGIGTHINTLGTDLTNQIGDLESDVQSHNTTLDTIGKKAAGNSADIDSLQTRADDTETKITILEAEEGSPPEGYLTGTMDNYTLHAKSSEAGNFTANVHLVYSPPVSVGNATTQDEALQAFYGSITWTALTIRDYVPTLTYNSTAWHVSQVWFNIGTFTMAANNETAVAVKFGGLNSTYEPDFSYVEVWPVLQ